MNWLKIILCRLGLLELVWLIDPDGRYTLSIKRKHNLGFTYAYRWWIINVHVTLEEGGTCSGGRYGISWKPYKK